MKAFVPLPTRQTFKGCMALYGNMCASKADAIVFIACVCPLSALVYASCYYLLLRLHPNEYEYAILAIYGFLQFILGYISGYYTAKTLYSVVADANVTLIE